MPLRPAAYPRMASFGDIPRLLSGDHVHHGFPPGVDWTWLGFPESWPLLRMRRYEYSGPGRPVGEAGDLWWWTLAEMQAHGGLWPSSWLAVLAQRIAQRFTGPLALAFAWLGALPLIWTTPDYRSRYVPAFQPHYRLQFGGSLFAVEGWSCRLNITTAGTLMNSAAADAALPFLAAAVEAWVTDEHAFLSTTTHLEYVKFNAIDALGHYVDRGSTRVTNYVTPPTGTVPPTLPPQVAIVVSLLTAHVRGKAHRGRMYTPALAADFSAQYGTHNDAALIAASATTFLNAVNAAVPDHGVSIISSTGESNHVTGVAVGKMFDTMRTRRKSIAEAPYALGDALD